MSQSIRVNYEQMTGTRLVSWMLIWLKLLA